MSNIGKNPIQIPEQVKINLTDNFIEVTGQKGTLKRDLPKEIKVSIDNNQILVKRNSDERRAKEFHGLIRTLIANMIEGVSEGFNKRLKYVGVGYRAQVQGKELELNVGYSHPVKITAPDGIEFSMDKNIIVVSGINKELVGKVASDIRAVRKPEPYKGKGIMYEGEKIRRKAGKSFKAGGE